MVTKSPVYQWLELFFRDKLWLSEPAKAALLCSDTESESESEESDSVSSGKTLDLGIETFVKKFDASQMSLWARIRTKLSIRDEKEPSKKKQKIDDIHESHCITITSDDRKVIGAIDVLNDTRGYLRKYCTWENCIWVVDPYTKSLLCTEYFHEALMCTTVSQRLADIPTFSRASLLCADLDKKQLHFTLVSDAVEMDQDVHSLEALELQSVIFQVLVSLCIAQERIKLKHHDLHLGNVMLSRRKEPGVWSAKTPFGIFLVPLMGWDATIIDYGLSSCEIDTISIARLDADLMQWGNSGSTSVSEPSDLGKSWGVWNPDLDGDTGYDFVMFIESIVDSVLDERPLPMTKLFLLSEIQSFAQTFCTDRNRPIQKSNVDWKALFTKFLPKELD
jgi:hypothetical protein